MFRFFSSARKRLFFAAALLPILASGCAGLPGEGSGGPDSADSATIEELLRDRTPLRSLTGTGRMIFTFSRDDLGFYWRFRTSEGELRSDDGTFRATLGAGGVIRTAGGGVLRTEILRTGKAASAEDLRDALYAVTSAEGPGTKGVTHVERRNAERGMPLTKCSASQYGQPLRVPFRARFIFWH